MKNMNYREAIDIIISITADYLGIKEGGTGQPIDDNELDILVACSPQVVEALEIISWKPECFKEILRQTRKYREGK